MLLRLGSVPTLVVSSADAARAVFQHNDRALSGRPALYAAARLSYGLRNVSFAPPDAFWRAARRACLSELLGAPRVRGFRGVREAEAAALVAAVADVRVVGQGRRFSREPERQACRDDQPDRAACRLWRQRRRRRRQQHPD